MTNDSMSMPAEQGYPVRVEFDYPEQLSRLLNGFFFVKWILLIPHLIVLILYGIAAWFCSIAAFVTILFAGNIPVGLWDFIFGYDRWQLRTFAYAALLTDQYPPFTNQPVDYPARVYTERPEAQSRLLVLVKWLFAIPHLIVLVFLTIAAFVVSIIAWLAIIFTGTYPRGMFDFVTGVARWWTRVIVYSGSWSSYNPYVGGLLRDEYPPFSLKP
jgi:hypothetical protein